MAEKPTYVLLDPCYILELVRNCFGEKALIDESGNFVKWKFIGRLHELQQHEQLLHLGNTLRAALVAWRRKKINVKLAARLLSESVVNSLRFCLEEQTYKFEGCEVTFNFIMIFNTILI